MHSICFWNSLLGHDKVSMDTSRVVWTIYWNYGMTFAFRHFVCTSVKCIVFLSGKCPFNLSDCYSHSVGNTDNHCCYTILHRPIQWQRYNRVYHIKLISLLSSINNGGSWCSAQLGTLMWCNCAVRPVSISWCYTVMKKCLLMYCHFVMYHIRTLWNSWIQSSYMYH